MPLRETNLIAVEPGPALDIYGAGPGDRVLPIARVSQRPYHYLCWAACAQMAFSNFGRDIPMCTFAGWKAGGNCCGTSPMPQPCDQVCWPHLAYNRFGMEWDALNGVLDEASIRDELFNHRRPVQMVINYSGAWHTTLIVGLSAGGDYLVHDPLIDERVACTYGMLLHAYGTGGTWRGTYLRLAA